MERVMNNGICRCCASEGTFKDLLSKHQWMGEDEIYADMLRECFDINLSTNENGEDGGICEVCITQLRNASNFKKQVLQTEEQFKKGFADRIFKNNIVKVEAGPIDYDDNVSEDNNLSDDFSSPEDDLPIKAAVQSIAEYDMPIKTEVEESKGKKRGRATTSRAKKSKLEDGETSKNKRGTKRKDQAASDRITLDKRYNFSTFIAIKPSGSVRCKNNIRARDKTPEKKPAQKAVTQKPPSAKIPDPKPEKPTTRRMRERPPDKIIQRRLTELDLHYDNIKTVLRCSNATPIRSKMSDKYACGYCLDQFHDPRDLKTHTIDTHSVTEDKPECLGIRSLSKYCVHLDVTNLKCELCDTDLEKLEDLIDHLKNDHDELIHTNIRNLMVPYKFESTDVNCVVCTKHYEDFVELQEHMSDHYKNYVCEFCDKAFILRSVMIEHKKLVHRV